MAGGVCSRCNRQIYAAWRTANGRHYHPHCFTCAICDTVVVQVVSHLETSNLKEIYCSRCFQQYFSKQDIAISHDKIDENSSEHRLGLLDQSEPHSVDSCDISGLCNVSAQLKNESQESSATDDDSRPTSQSHSENESAESSSSSPEEGIKNIIEQADSISERQKRSFSAGMTPLKREGSMIQQPFISRIPRFQSSSKLPVPSMKSCSTTNSIEGSTTVINLNANKSPFLAPLKPHSTKINEYLSRKVMKLNEIPKFPSKPSFPMKPKSSASELSRNKTMKTPLQRCPTFFRTSSSGSGINLNIRKSETADTSLQPQKKLSPSAFRNNCNPPPLPVSSKDFSVARKSSSILLKHPGSSLNSTTNISSAFLSSTEDSENLKTNSIKSKTSSCALPLPTCQQLLSVMLKPQKEWPSTPIQSIEDEDKLSIPIPNVEKRPESCRWNENLSCPICFEPLIEGKRSGRFSENIVTGCGHIFHRECIRNWLGKKGNNRCPICSKFCVKESIIAVYLEANVVSDLNSKTNEAEELSTLLSTLRQDYEHLNTEYQALREKSRDYELKSAVTDSLRSAYEVECRNKVELQCENKRLQRKIQELKSIIHVAQGDTIPETKSEMN